MIKVTAAMPDYVSNYTYIKTNGLVLKNYVDDMLGTITTGANARVMEGIVIQLERFAKEFDSRRTVAGLASYAVYVEGDAGYDIEAEINAVVAAIVVVGSTIRVNTPTDADGYLLIDKLGGDGKKIPREFDATDAAPVVIAMQALQALIN